MRFKLFAVLLGTIFVAALITMPTPDTVSGESSKGSGSLTVRIKPKKAKQDGGRWRVDGGAWKKNGQTVSGLSDGQHTVTFKTIDGWVTPKRKKPNIDAGETTKLTGKYKVAESSTIMLPGNVPMEFVWIPAGSFMMGKYTDEQGADTDETPQHQVTFAEGFWMGKYEVTQAQWLAVMESNPAYYTGDLNRPVEQITWEQAQEFIEAINDLELGDVRLPSEAEWEYACRAGTSTRFYWGDDLTNSLVGNYAWYAANYGSSTHAVGGKLPNAWGLYDMIGNVFELCEDQYHADYTNAPTDGSAWLSPATGFIVLRGGAWTVLANDCRSAHRVSFGANGSFYNLGFRLAR